MLNPSKHHALCIAASLLVACGDPPDDDEPPVETDTEQVCDDGAPAYELSVDRHVTQTGPTGNDIAADDEALFVVESDGNTVSRFDLTDDRMDQGFVTVGAERNPYSVDVDGDEIWVTNLLAETVTVADADDGEIIDELDDELYGPSSIALSDDYAYVGNVEFLGVDEGYGPGSITVIDRASREVASRFETAFQNPHFITIEELDGQKVLLVSGSGEVIWDGERTNVESEGGLEWLDVHDDPVEPDSHAFAIDQQQLQTVGAPSRAHPSPDESALYFVSGIAPVLFVFDVDEMQWRHDATDPIELYEANGDTTHRGAMGPDGLLWITAYNEDQLHLLDTACDEPVVDPVDLGEHGDMLEGAQAIEVVERGETIEGFYLLSAAGSMGSVQLRRH